MKTISGESIDELKLRYIDMLDAEGCLNEVLFDKPEWDDEPYCYSPDYYGVEKLKALVPDEVIVDHYGIEYFDCEGIA